MSSLEAFNYVSENVFQLCSHDFRIFRLDILYEVNNYSAMW